MLQASLRLCGTRATLRHRWRPSEADQPYRLWSTSSHAGAVASALAGAFASALAGALADGRMQECLEPKEVRELEEEQQVQQGPGEEELSADL